MKKTKWLEAKGIFLISGGASANSVFFEEIGNRKIFFDYYDRFLSGMCELLNYKCTETGWALLIHTKDEASIRKAYLKQRDKSYKADRTKDRKEVERMLSDHSRYFLSSYAKASNIKLDRDGVVVKRKFDKYAIRSEQSYEEAFEKLCDLQDCMYQQKLEKYRPDENLFNQVSINGDERFWSGNWAYGLPLQMQRGLEDGVFSDKGFSDVPEIQVIRAKSDVLRRILEKSTFTQNPRSNTNSTNSRHKKSTPKPK